MLVFSIAMTSEHGSLYVVEGCLMVDGIEACRIGYLPRYAAIRRDTYDGHYVQMVEDYSHSSNPSDQARSRRVQGLWRGVILTK